MYSFCTPKGLLLQSKRTPFALQKDPFCNPKGLLFRGRPYVSYELCNFLVLRNVKQVYKLLNFRKFRS